MAEKANNDGQTTEQVELNRYVDAWLKMKAQGATIGLWEDPALVSKFMSEMGRRGGSAKNPKKGFGSMSAAKRRAAARKGLETRWGQHD